MFDADKKMLSVITNDPDIKSLSHFEDWVSANFRDEPEEFAVGDEGDIRVIDRRIREGQASKLNSGSDSLRNNYNEYDDVYEVYNSDRIGYRTYDKMDKDPMISLGKYVLTGLVSNLKYTIKSPDDKIREVVNFLYKPHHNDLIRNMIRGGLKYGFTFGEKVWQRTNVTVYKKKNSEHTQIYKGRVATLRKVKWLDPRNNFEFYKNQNDELEKVKQQQSGKFEKVEVDRKKLVWYIQDREFSSIFGSSRYKNAYLSWYDSMTSTQWLKRQLRRSGSPHLEGRYPDGEFKVDSQGRKVPANRLMKKYAKALTSTGSVSLPSTKDEEGDYLWRLEYKEPKNTTIDPQLSYLEMLDRRKLQSLGILDSILMAGANFSEVDAKVDLMMLIIEDLVDQIQQVIKMDVIDYLAAYNFGDEAAEMVDFEISKSNLGLRKILKEVATQSIRVLGSRSDVTPKVFPNMEDVLDQLSIPTDKWEEVTEEVEQEMDDQMPDFEGRKAKEERDNDPEDNQNGPDDRDRDRQSKRDSSVDA